MCGGWLLTFLLRRLWIWKEKSQVFTFQGLDVDSLVIEHIQVNKAPKMRRRTYRAHGRINPYMSSPCHIEMILTEKEQIVPKPEEEVAQKKKVRSVTSWVRFDVGREIGALMLCSFQTEGGVAVMTYLRTPLEYPWKKKEVISEQPQ